MQKRLVWIGIAICLAGIGYFYQRFANNRWPAEELISTVDAPTSTELDSRFEIVVRTNQSFERTERLGVKAVVRAADLEVHDAKLINVKGSAHFHIDATARSVVDAESLNIVFQYGDREISGPMVKFSVPMPLFFDEEEKSFMELVRAPDSSIYGSHITVWSPAEQSEVLTVTGHAASSVCRVASAALFGLAYHSDINSPYFFLGAGTGSLDLRSLKSRNEGLLREFEEKYPNIHRELNTLVPDPSDADIMQLMVGGKPRSLVDLMEMTAEAISGDWTQGLNVEPTELKEIAEQIDDIESVIGETNDLTGDEGRQAVTGLRNLMRRDADTVVAALWYSRVKIVAPVVDMVREWNQGKRDELLVALNEIVVNQKALDTLQTDFAELQNRTGLLDVKPGFGDSLSKAADIQRLWDKIGAWVKAPNEDVVELAALASGYDGCVLVPFYTATGNQLTFEIESELLDADGNQNWRDLLQSTAALELANSARQAVERLQQLDRDSSLGMQMRAGMAPQEKDAFQEWASEVNTVTVNLFDDIGRPSGTRKEDRTTASMILDSWHTASRWKSSQFFFARLVKSAERMKNDPRFKDISDACLIDSLLRGWKLAFSDDEMEEKFEAWSKPTRARIWASIWRQADKMNVDLRRVVANETREGTVFRVTRRDNGFRIAPMFVADIQTTRCIKDPQKKKELVAYATSWSGRRPVLYDERQNHEIQLPTARDPQELAEKLLLEIDQEISKLTDPSAEHSNRFDQLSEAIKSTNQLEHKLGKALGAAPEFTVSWLVGQLLGQWPEVAALRWEGEPEQAQLKAVETLLRSENGEKSARETIFVEVEAGTWPFSDHYRRLSSQLRQEAERISNVTERTNITKLAGRLDARAAEIERGSENTPSIGTEDERVREISRTLQSAIKKLQQRDLERGITLLMQSINLLNEGERTLDEWDDAPYVDHLFDQFADELGTASKKYPEAGFDDDLRELNAYLDDDTSIEPPLRAFQQISEKANERVYPISLDEDIWRLGTKAEYLEKRVARMRMPNATDTRPRVVSALREAADTLKKAAEISWSKETVATEAQAISTLAQSVADSRYYEALDRQAFRHQIVERKQVIVAAAIRAIERQHREPNRRSLEMLIQVHWLGGDYREALKRLYVETLRQQSSACFADSKPTSKGITRAQAGELFWNASTSTLLRSFRLGVDLDEWIRRYNEVEVTDAQGLNRTIMLAHLVRNSERDLLKACVYSGDQFFGASIFGRRINNWVKKPRSVEDVVVDLKLTGPGIAAENNGAWFSRLSREWVDKEIPDDLKNPRPGGYGVLRSFPTRLGTPAFEVVDEFGAKSVVTIARNDETGWNAFLAEKFVAKLDHLARLGVDVPVHLRVDRTSKLLNNGDVVVTRQSLANLSADVEKLIDLVHLDIQQQWIADPAGRSSKSALETYLVTLSSEPLLRDPANLDRWLPELESDLLRSMTTSAIKSGADVPSGPLSASPSIQRYVDDANAWIAAFRRESEVCANELGGDHPLVRAFDELGTLLKPLDPPSREGVAQALGSTPDERLAFLTTRKGDLLTADELQKATEYFGGNGVIADYTGRNAAATKYYALKNSLGGDERRFLDLAFDREVKSQGDETLYDRIDAVRYQLLPNEFYETKSLYELTDDELVGIPRPRLPEGEERLKSLNRESLASLSPQERSVLEFLAGRPYSWDPVDAIPPNPGRILNQVTKDDVTTLSARHFEVDGTGGGDGKLHLHCTKQPASGGDGFVLQREWAGGEFGDAIVVDTSCDANGAKRIINAIQKKPDGEKRVRIVITHQDRDHIQGLEYILAEAKENQIAIDEVLIGKLPDKLANDALATRWKDLESQLNSVPGLKRTHKEDQTLARWTNENVRSLVRSTSHSLVGELRTIQLRPFDGVHIELSQISDPKTSNQSSLITSVNFKGNRHYLTGDADGKVVRRLIREGAHGQSGVMKWPHHISIPKDLDSPDALALKDLIRERKPHTIILSNRASNQTEANLKLIEKLVEDVMGKDRTRIIYTGRYGDIHIIVINSNRQTGGEANPEGERGDIRLFAFFPIVQYRRSATVQRGRYLISSQRSRNGLHTPKRPEIGCHTNESGGFRQVDSLGVWGGADRERRESGVAQHRMQIQQPRSFSLRVGSRT